ncbi:hypothetical protein Tco_1499394 [Tanacetum coccineum]
MDMFRDTLHPPVETPNNPFIAPVNIKVIKSLMQKISYQGVIDKVSTFYKKFLAQPWQTMFKVFNRCLTTRTSGHDQTKINILQLFHAKKDVIQYPRFTKLIIADLMKFPSIPQRLDENYHSIKDDIPLVNVYSIGNVLFRGMLIPNAFLTDEIRATDDYKESPTLTTTSPQKKKRKQVAGETSSPRKSLKVTIKQNKPSTTPIPPHSDDRERGEMAKATLLSLTLHETALAAEAQDNIAKVQEKLVEEKIEKMVKGEEDVISYAIVDDDDETEKEKKDEKKDDNEDKDNDDQTDHTLELTKTVSPSTTTTSKVKRKTKAKSKARSTSIKYKILPGSLASMCRRHGLIRIHLQEIALTNVLELVSKEFAAHAPGIIAKLFQNHMQNTTLNLYPTTSSTTTTTSTTDTQHQFVLNAFCNHDDHHYYDAPPEGEKWGEKAYILLFPEDDLEEKLKRWVRKEFKTFNEEARITEVVRVTTDQQHGLDYMEQIIVIRENDKPDSFSEAEFKYLNKNGIEDLYYLCLNKKVNFQSDQIRVNLTAPTLTFHGIKAHDPYSIIDKPSIGLIYLNNKEEKRVMYLAKIIKFCDAMLERVLKEVKLKIFKFKSWKKPPFLDEKVGIIREWKTDSTCNEATLIINP